VRRAYLGLGGQTHPMPRRVVRHFGLTIESGVREETLERGSPAADAIARPIEVLIVRRDRTLTLTVTPVESASRTG